jgi:integrase
MNKMNQKQTGGITMKVSEAIETVYARISNSPNTTASFKTTYEAFRAPFGDRECSGVLPEEINAYVTAIDASAATKALRFSHIRVLFDEALQALKRARIMPTWENPCSVLEFKRPQNEPEPRPDNFIGKMETARATLRKHYQLIFDIGIRCSPRIEEILSITPRMIQKQGSGACCIRVTVKGGKLQNKVIPPGTTMLGNTELPDLCDALSSYIAENDIKPDERLFKMSRQSVWETLKARGIEPHDLRRFAASRALDQGKSLETIRGMLGHSNVSTTARYILPLSASAQAEAMRGL